VTGFWHDVYFICWPSSSFFLDHFQVATANGFLHRQDPPTPSFYPVFDRFRRFPESAVICFFFVPLVTGALYAFVRAHVPPLFRVPCAVRWERDTVLAKSLYKASIRNLAQGLLAPRFLFFNSFFTRVRRLPYLFLLARWFFVYRRSAAFLLF